MPVTFSFKLFLRLAGLSLLVIALCALVWWGLTSVRHQAWQEQRAAPLINWLARMPAPLEHYHWLDQLYDFRLTASQDLGLGAVQRERLGYGHTLVLGDELGLTAVANREDGGLVSLRFQNLYRDLAEATALIVLWHLNETLPADRMEATTLLSEALEVSLETIEDVSRLPSTAVLERAWERNLAFFEDDGEGHHVLLRLQDGTLLRLDPAEDFHSLPWPVLALLLGLVGLILGIAVNLLMRDLDRNLRAVESVAVRIARGELEARIESGRESNLISRLARSFNSMADQIQRLVEVQREMIHAVSHELRTPVARIRFGVQMIEGARDEKSLQRQLDGIDGDIQELDELIDEILTYARLEQGGPVFSLRPEIVTDIVRQVVREQQVVHTDKEIDAVIPDRSEQYRMSDIEPRYLHRAIQNLVGNACRYANTRVQVHCLLDDENCRIDVEDDGPGIPEQDWEKVFSAFARLDDSRTRTSGGYGLGLSIVKRILYWHGGQSFVGRSEALGGARFSLVWPRRQ